MKYLYHNRLFLCATLIALGFFWLSAPFAQAWDQAGHFYIARGAVKSLPSSVPEFFQKGIKQIAHSANSPDVIKNPKLKQITSSEAANHFMDMELLRGRKLPKTRFEYVKMCKYKLHDNASYIGFLPYAIVEWQQRLTIAFAQFRRWKDNKFIQQDALFTAGIMIHYAGDLVQPLHTTINYNGKVNARGRSPHSGIHQKVDFMPAYMTYNQIFSGKPIGVDYHADNIFDYVINELKQSHSKVDTVYSLEKKLPRANRSSAYLAPEVKKFIKKRMHAGASFSASLILSAWERSKDINLPRWLKRDKYDYHFDPDKLPNKW